MPLCLCVCACSQEWCRDRNREEGVLHLGGRGERRKDCALHRQRWYAYLKSALKCCALVSMHACTRASAVHPCLPACRCSTHHSRLLRTLTRCLPNTQVSCTRAWVPTSVCLCARDRRRRRSISWCMGYVHAPQLKDDTPHGFAPACQRPPASYSTRAVCVRVCGDGALQENIPVLQLTREIAAIMQEFTQSGGVRPFGVSLLVAGYVSPRSPSRVRTCVRTCRQALPCVHRVHGNAHDYTLTTAPPSLLVNV